MSNNTKDSQPIPFNRLQELTYVLKDLKEIAQEKHQAHSSPEHKFELEIATDSLALVEKRLRLADMAGPKWLIEIEKTTLGNIARLVVMNRSVIENKLFDSKFSSTLENAKNLISLSMIQNPQMFIQDNFFMQREFENINRDESSWKDLNADQSLKFIHRIPLTVLRWSIPNVNMKQGWLAVVGGISFGFCSTKEAAYSEAEKGLLFFINSEENLNSVRSDK